MKISICDILEKCKLTGTQVHVTGQKKCELHGTQAYNIILHVLSEHLNH